MPKPPLPRGQQPDHAVPKPSSTESAPLLSRPHKPAANNNRPASQQRDDAVPLGKGSGNNFTFASSAAQSEWRRRAYAQAVHPDNWHLGDAADSESARAIMAGITGPTAPLYRGPDGRHYFANPKTIEPEAWRQIRRQHFKDRTVADLSLEFDRTGRMPGEAEALLALDSAAEGIVPENTSSSPSIRPDTATLSPHGRAILAGMEHAGQTDPHVVAKMTQATDPAATDTRPDVNPIPVDERNPASASLTQASPRAVGRIQETKKKQPVAPIDAERRAELLVFEPVGKGASSFGHVAISFGDLVFSWSPEGLHLARKADYLAANGFRDGKGYPLRLTETEAKELEAHILRFANTASYNPIFANCVDPIELGLEHLGYDVGLTVLPAQLQDALFASGLASEDRSSQYLADSKRKAPDPAMPWSSWSGPR